MNIRRNADSHIFFGWADQANARLGGVRAALWCWLINIVLMMFTAGIAPREGDESQQLYELDRRQEILPRHHYSKISYVL